MGTKFLLHFAHEHIPFRWTEFLALTSKFDCKFKLISKDDHIETRPYIIVELENEADTHKLVQSAKGSYLLKGLFELWAQSDRSLEHLAEEATKSAQFLSKVYSKSDQTFRVNCESFGAKTSQSTKVEWIRKMIFLETFQSRPDLSNPKQIYSIFEMNEKRTDNGLPIKEYYFGRQLTQGDRATIHAINLKERTFIANTSMDPMLSLISANCAKVKPNDVVYDPFVGSGSLLIAAAHMGAYVMGSDIDWMLLHGKSRPSRKGQVSRKEGESVRANLRQYSLEDRYLDVMVSDITRSPLVDKFTVDSIISDPPYGVRECSEKIGGALKERHTVKEHKVRYPSKVSYTMGELFSDLLSLSVKHLSLHGRLVFYLPVTKVNGLADDAFIPKHPCLNLVSYCEQPLAAKISRLMVVMEKIKEPMACDQVFVPQIIRDMNFREVYFSKT